MRVKFLPVMLRKEKGKRVKSKIKDVIIMMDYGI